MFISRNELKYLELSVKIHQCREKVHSASVLDFLIIYRRAFEVALRNRNITFKAERELLVYYQGVLVGKRKVDL